MGILQDINDRARSAVRRWLNGSSTMLDPEERKAQNLILLARQYYDGDQPVFMTDRQEAWLKQHGSDVQFTVNHCPTVVDAVVERLQVTGFTMVDDELAKTNWEWWKAMRMDNTQNETHKWAVRDGET